MTKDARIDAAAKALCAHSSMECDINEGDNWTRYKSMFKKDAAIALAAADAVGYAPKANGQIDKLTKHVASLTEEISQRDHTLSAYRERFGVLGSSHSLSTDRSAAVSNDYHWLPITADTPRSAKLLLLGAGGVAHMGQYDGDPFWVGWFPLPRRAP